MNESDAPNPKIDPPNRLTRRQFLKLFPTGAMSLFFAGPGRPVFEFARRFSEEPGSDEPESRDSWEYTDPFSPETNEGRFFNEPIRQSKFSQAALAVVQIIQSWTRDPNAIQVWKPKDNARHPNPDATPKNQSPVGPPAQEYIHRSQRREFSQSAWPYLRQLGLSIPSTYHEFARKGLQSTDNIIAANQGHLSHFALIGIFGYLLGHRVDGPPVVTLGTGASTPDDVITHDPLINPDGLRLQTLIERMNNDDDSQNYTQGGLATSPRGHSVTYRLGTITPMRLRPPFDSTPPLPATKEAESYGYLKDIRPGTIWINPSPTANETPKNTGSAGIILAANDVYLDIDPSTGEPLDASIPTTMLLVAELTGIKVQTGTNFKGEHQYENTQGIRLSSMSVEAFLLGSTNAKGHIFLLNQVSRNQSSESVSPGD